jgi:hypothetical protein
MLTRRVSLTLALLAAPSLGGVGALRVVTAAQERYRATHGVYAASVDQLGVHPESGIRVEILLAGSSGWQARATHATEPGRSCVVFVGALGDLEAPRTDADREMAGEEGIPLCDRMR